MKMKAVLIGIALILALSNAQAQKGEMRQRMEAQKTAFITKALNLDTETAQKFWPVYNEYENERKALRDSYSIRDRREGGDLSDAEAEKMLVDIIELERKNLVLKEKYIDKMKSVISVRQIIRLYRTERQFKEQMLRGVRNRSENRRDRSGRR